MSHEMEFSDGLDGETESIPVFFHATHEGTGTRGEVSFPGLLEGDAGIDEREAEAGVFGEFEAPILCGLDHIVEAFQGHEIHGIGHWIQDERGAGPECLFDADLVWFIEYEAAYRMGADEFGDGLVDVVDDALLIRQRRFFASPFEGRLLEDETFAGLESQEFDAGPDADDRACGVEPAGFGGPWFADVLTLFPYPEFEPNGIGVFLAGLSQLVEADDEFALGFVFAVLHRRFSCRR